MYPVLELIKRSKNVFFVTSIGLIADNLWWKFHLFLSELARPGVDFLNNCLSDQKCNNWNFWSPGRTVVRTRDLLICSQLLCHWAIHPIAVLHCIPTLGWNANYIGSLTHSTTPDFCNCFLDILAWTTTKNSCMRNVVCTHKCIQAVRLFRSNEQGGLQTWHTPGQHWISIIKYKFLEGRSQVLYLQTTIPRVCAGGSLGSKRGTFWKFISKMWSPPNFIDFGANKSAFGRVRTCAGKPQ